MSSLQITRARVAGILLLILQLLLRLLSFVSGEHSSSPFASALLRGWIFLCFSRIYILKCAIVTGAKESLTFWESIKNNVLFQIHEFVVVVIFKSNKTVKIIQNSNNITKINQITPTPEDSIIITCTLQMKQINFTSPSSLLLLLLPSSWHLDTNNTNGNWTEMYAHLKINIRAARNSRENSCWGEASKRDKQDEDLFEQQQQQQQKKWIWNCAIHIFLMLGHSWRVIADWWAM
jgi:hypothetical protein